MKRILLYLVRLMGGRAISRSINVLVRRSRLSLTACNSGSNGPWSRSGVFDHFLTSYYVWPQTRTPLWLERGIFGLLAMRQGARVLELCCGDGFNAYHFYSIRAAASSRPI